MKSLKFSMFLSLLLVVILFLAACTNSETDTEPSKGMGGDGGESELAENQELNFTSSVELTTIDSIQSSNVTSFNMLRHLKSGLMRVNADSEPVPDMAAEMPEVSEDGTVYTFKIREDAVWSNGDPVTAHDFEFAWETAVDPDTAAGMAYIFGGASIKNASEIMDQNSDLFGKVDQLGVKALDDKTLRVTLEYSTPYFLTLMGFTTFLPVNEEFYKEQGDQYAQELENVLYNGPFTLAEWDHGASWTLGKNPDYWDAENVHLEKVNYNFVGELSTQVNLYNTGKIDSVALTSEFVPQFEESEEFNSSLGGFMQFMRLNLDRVEAFKNDKIRDAMLNAIDREDLTEIVLNNGSVPAQYIVAKDYAFGPNGEDFREKAPEGHNIIPLEEAQQLWKEGLEEVGTDTVEVELMIYKGDVQQSIAEYVKNQLETNLSGMKITINSQPVGNFGATESNMDYDMSRINYLPDYQDPMTFLEPWTTGQFWNRTGWSNEEYDQLIKQARNSGSEPEKRWQLLHEAENLLINEAPIIPLFQTGSAYLQKTYVKDLQHSPNFDWTYAYIEAH